MENRPHYTSEYKINGLTYKCHDGSNGTGCDYGGDPNKNNTALCLLKRLKNDLTPNNITEPCGGEGKFKSEGRSNIEKNIHILSRIRKINDVLATNIKNFLDFTGTYDKDGTTGLIVPDTSDFQPDTTKEYRPPRRRPRGKGSAEKKQRDAQKRLNRQLQARVRKQENQQNTKVKRVRKKFRKLLQPNNIRPDIINETPVLEIERTKSAPGSPNQDQVPDTVQEIVNNLLLSDIKRARSDQESPNQNRRSRRKLDYPLN